MKAKRSGLTLVEILVVVAVIAILTGMLLPAISMVKKTAREAKQKVQFTAIDLALATFRNDYGSLPPSDSYSWLGSDTTAVQNTSGAQKLAEALLGWDLLGFHPDSGWRADGMNRWPYRVGTTTYTEGTYFLYDRTVEYDMDKRKDRYLDLDTANAVRLGVTANHDGLFNLGAVGGPLATGSDTFVIGDVFGKGKTVTLPDGRPRKSGLPVLYYRADTSEKVLAEIYNFNDNDLLIYAKEQTDVINKGTPPVRLAGALWNPLAGQAGWFHDYITDWRATTTDFAVPHKPDSYILISAGNDGFYGTDDDICNFQK